MKLSAMRLAMTLCCVCIMNVVANCDGVSASTQDERDWDAGKHEMDSISHFLEWKSLSSKVAPEEVVNILWNFGWPKELVDEKLRGSKTYDLYKRTVGPGMESYLAIPSDKIGNPIEFNAQDAQFYNAALSDSLGSLLPSADEIRREILKSLEAAITALCDLGAKPSQIRASANAFGIVEVEATWDANEICDK